MKDEIFDIKEMQKLQELLIKHNKTITCAESCTGGLISSYITQISGSSNIFKGSIVSYSNEIKEQELGVKNSTLEKYGAVSLQTVKKMLQGSIKKFNANYAIAVSGIAGPDGGTNKKPVGTVIIGVMDDKGAFEIDNFLFQKSRIEVQKSAAKTSLKKILNFVKKSLDK